MEYDFFDEQIDRLEAVFRTKADLNTRREWFVELKYLHSDTFKGVVTRISKEHRQMPRSIMTFTDLASDKKLTSFSGDCHLCEGLKTIYAPPRCIRRQLYENYQACPDCAGGPRIGTWKSGHDNMCPCCKIETWGRSEIMKDRELLISGWVTWQFRWSMKWSCVKPRSGNGDVQKTLDNEQRYRTQSNNFCELSKNERLKSIDKLLLRCAEKSNVI